jgi:predicted alpha/beta superfamily hydrolase
MAKPGGLPRSDIASGFPKQGQLERHENFHSALLDNQRTIEVYLPPGYQGAAKRAYPVLYLHDGQNLFERSAASPAMTWRADATADRLIHEGRLPPLILVAIASTPDRLNEYATMQDRKEQAGGRGLLYARFVLEEVKPFIDRNYHSRPDRTGTGVAGSSMGGLISLLMAQHFSDQIGLCAALSPSLWWAEEAILRDFSRDLAWVNRTRFWLDMGTREGGGREPGEQAVARARRLVRKLDRTRLLPGHDFYYMEVSGAGHDESHWARRFDKVLLYLFGRPLRNDRRS